MKAMRIILCVISGALLGLLLYAIGTHVVTKGYLVEWQKLASPPARLVELALDSSGTVYGRASDGTTYHYWEWGNECWVKDELPQGLPDYDTNTTTCDFSKTAFRWLRKAPNSVADCVQGVEHQVDCYADFTYVLDRNGDVWKWMNPVCADGFRWLCLPVISAIIGAVLGLAVGSMVHAERNRQPL